MATAARGQINEREYLRREREAETRSEYDAGEMFAMPGASYEHSVIVGNLIRELGNRLRDRDCTVCPSDMRVRNPSGLFTYPDIVVHCGKPAFLDNRRDTLTDALLLVEVLSASTEAYDRGRKFTHYRGLPSLQEYVLVSTTDEHVDRYRRRPEGWVLDDAHGRDAVLHLASLDVDLPLGEIYAKVELPAPAPPR